jgi:Leucine-rich repeat (LRR) protein
LDNNNLYGELPTEIALLSNLTSISIKNPPDSTKSLYGRLDGIFKGVSGLALAQLTSLSIVGNIFTGGIPSELNELTKLRSLDLSNNDLRGYIPYALDSMSDLEYVNLQNNRLTGGIPSEFCLGAINLIDLNLSGNIFTSVPESIDALTSLSRLNMAKNQFVIFPTQITRMLNLQSLDLSDNNFGGSVPSSIGNMKSLQELYLRNNDLSGNIPESIGNLVQLSKVLDLSQNRFSGPIPTTLSQLVQLQQLFLNSNELSGSLPEELIRWNTLNLVRLDENVFTGTIPILLCQEWSGIQSYADCSDFSVSSTGTIVPSSCFTFCCQSKECVCNYEVTDPLRCLG